MSNWVLKQQETEGTYQFSGTFLVTSRVNRTIPVDTIASMYLKIQELVKEKGGLDYLQVFVNTETEQKLFFIDQLNKEMIESGNYRTEDNHCTLMYSSEY
ncbi:MAG: DUF960 domain-containing protein [Flavobacteriales bacterium]|jgi:hypothetical protein|nr:DUF960 domain-containing protein [Flavobacteriales bacterium]